VENAHVRFMKKWAGQVNAVQKSHESRIRKTIIAEQKRLGTRKDSRQDAQQESIRSVDAIINDMVADYVKRVSGGSAKSRKQTVAIESGLESTSSEAWADNIESLVSLTPGLDKEGEAEVNEFLISEEPDIPPKVRKQWISQQLGLISGKPVSPVKVAGRTIETISGRSMRRIRKTVTEGILRGTRVESIMKSLGEIPGMTSRHAELIARDQVVKQNGRMTRIRHEGIGVTHYTWQTVGDQRVRKKHQAFQGRRYSYTKGAGVDGVNPGEEIQCRCWPSPDLLGAVRNLRAKRQRGDRLTRLPYILRASDDPVHVSHDHGQCAQPRTIAPLARLARPRCRGRRPVTLR
jgi:SPP1 gp7 family putative phage head morphogenesis protein